MSGEKTEQPTAKKLREAREKGQVAKSKDVSSTAILVALFAVLAIMIPRITSDLQDLIRYASTLYNEPFHAALDAMLSATITVILRGTYPILLVTIIVAIGSNMVQVGVMLSGKAIMPDLNKVNPMEGLKKIFSIKGVVELLKNVLKISFLGILIYKVIEQAMPDLTMLAYGGREALMPALGTVLTRVAVNTVFAYAVIASFDYFFQMKQHIKQLMMSKDEIKQEFKQMEGSPEIKQKRKQLHQELLSEGTAAAVQESTAVVTNPTELAVAIYYKRGETPLPVVKAKGEGVMAGFIRRVAEKEGVPIMQNVPLARVLYREAAINDYIPEMLIEPVAEVLRWVQSLEENGVN